MNGIDPDNGIGESALAFGCAGETLHGVLARPHGAASDTAVVIVVGGPQVRIGSHRQFVQLARTLARAGHACLRFDVRGMGDSSGELRSFEQLDDDIAAACAALREAEPGVTRIVLWGLCDGASAALLYLDRRRDARIGGLVLVNPWVRTAVGEARTRVKHYYLARLAQREFWHKLLAGGVGWRAVRGLLANLRAARVRAGHGGAAAGEPALPYTERMARAWERFDGPILLALSEHDYTAREFEDHSTREAAWQRAFARRPVAALRLEGADHTCSQRSAREQLEAATLALLATRTPGQPAVRDR